MHKVPPVILLTGAILLGLSLTPTSAEAQELTLYYGKFLGGDLIEDAPLINPGSVQLEDSPVLGTRFSPSLLGPIELSFMYTGSSIFPGTEQQGNVRVIYTEANVLVGLLPGPVRPFLTAGLGLHRFSPEAQQLESITRLGYNVGVGLKAGVGKVGMRVDLRDHITPLKVADLAPGLPEFFDIESDTVVHNVELSVGLMLRF